VFRPSGRLTLLYSIWDRLRIASGAKNHLAAIWSAKTLVNATTNGGLIKNKEIFKVAGRPQLTHRRQAQLLGLAGRLCVDSLLSMHLDVGEFIDTCWDKRARFMKKSGSLAVLILVASLSLTGCASYTLSKETTPSQTRTTALSSITITASTNTVNAGSSLQLTAQGTYSDNSTATLTAQVMWESSDSTVASVNALGVLTALKAGAVTVTATDGATSGAFGINVTAGQVTPTSTSVTISAAYGSQTPATTTLTVSNATIQRIALTPSSPTIALGTTQAFDAVGTFSDGSSRDITSVSQWTSSAPGVATVNQSGVATSAGQGQTNVTVAFRGVSNTALLTVQ
jgi:Bacterial Ig-like domain (group 2)